MQQQETHAKQFTKSHIAIIALSAVALVGLTAMKDGWQVFDFFKASDSIKQYTYEMALADAGAGFYPTDSGDTSANADQLAALDPSLYEGSVLGASTGTDDSVFPRAEEVLTPEIIAGIKMNRLGYTDAQALSQYAAAVQLVELEDGSDVILANMTSEDPATLLEASRNVRPLVEDLLLIPVPKDAEEYHALKLLYYLNLSVLAEGYAGAENAPDPKDTGVQIFSITERMQRVHADILNRYGVGL